MPQPAPRVYLQEFTAANGQPFAFQMVEVKGGTFQMGREERDSFDDEKPIHTVKVSDFWMGQYLVTQALWEAVMGKEQISFYFKGDERPAECVFYDFISSKFIPQLCEITGEVYRLPTEAEWEYAARGGLYQLPYRFAGGNRMEDVGWYLQNSHSETKPVGLKKPNALGLYDLSGNVYEWCADWYGGSEYYQECLDAGVVENPTGAMHGDRRVLRGGCWFNLNTMHCGVSNRTCYNSQIVNNLVGFRLVVSVLQSVGWEKRLKTHEQKKKK